MVLIHKSEDCSVTINFYVKPAVLELNHNGQFTHITINGDFIDGNEGIPFANWLEKSRKKLEDIVWEWETGNDDFELIDNKIF